MSAPDLPDWQRATVPQANTAILYSGTQTTDPITTPVLGTSPYQSIAIHITPGTSNVPVPMVITVDWMSSGATILTQSFMAWAGSDGVTTPQMSSISMPALTKSVKVNFDNDGHTNGGKLVVIGSSVQVPTVSYSTQGAPAANCPTSGVDFTLDQYSSQSVYGQPLSMAGVIYVSTINPPVTLDIFSIPPSAPPLTGFYLQKGVTLTSDPTEFQIPVIGCPTYLQFSGAGASGAVIQVMFGNA